LKALLSGLVCLLVAVAAYGQANSQPVLKPRPNTAVQELSPAEDNSNVSPDTPVITINGVCDKSATAGQDCKTVVTREQFENIVKTQQPNLPPAARKQVATRLVNILLLSQKAHELGLDKGPEFDQQMYVTRLLVTARLASEQMQKEAAKVSDQQIADYYAAHSNEFRTISYDRIYVPKQKQVDTTAQKPDDPDAQKKREASEAEMKEEADKVRARAAAGEDFTKLQQEAYDFAGMKLKASTTRVDKVRKNALPATDAAIFDLKQGEVSQVFNDPQGYMIYKVEDFQVQPLADIREEVSRTLQAQKMKEVSESLQKTATTGTTYNDTYFAVPAPPTLRNPGEAPQPAPKSPTSSPQAPQPPGKK
jgi:hypothetical protein